MSSVQSSPSKPRWRPYLADTHPSTARSRRRPFKHLVNGSLGKVKCFESRESAARKGILEAPQPKPDPTDGPNSDDDERGVRGVVLSAPGVSSTGLIRGSEADLPKTFPVVKVSPRFGGEG